MPVAIYPGSFDPLTNGHLSIIQRGLSMFDRLVVAIATNPNKGNAMFSVEERVALIREACPDPRVEVDHFQGLLVQYAQRRDISVILRGLRAVSDFEYECQMANMNRSLDSKIETVFIMTGEDYFYISSRIVREVATLGGSVEDFVPPNVHKRLQEKFGKGAAPS